MVEKKGHEVIIGGKTDPVFGPVILFGMGGVGVELFKDVLNRASTTKHHLNQAYDGRNQSLPLTQRLPRLSTS